MQNEKDYVSCNGSEIYFEAWGEGPPVVLGHGALKDLRVWDVLRYVKDYRFIAFDWPYHGNTISNSHKRKAIDEEFSIFVNKLDLDYFALITDSFSNKISQKYINRDENKGRVVVSIMINYRPLLPSEKALRNFLIPVKNGMVPFFIRLQDCSPQLTKKTIRGIGSKIVDYRLNGVEIDCKENKQQLQYVIDTIFTLDPKYKRNGTRTLIVNGEDGKNLNSRIKKLERLPNYDVVFIPGGHDVRMSRPEQFRNIVTNYLHEHYNYQK